MKKTALLLFTISILLLFSGCYLSYKTYYSDLSDYPGIFELSGFRFGNEEIPTVFPDTIEEKSTEEFFCRYDEQLPLGEGFQILLKVRFENEDVFQSEVTRISSLSSRVDEYFEKTGFEAYATIFGRKYTFEYSLVDVENHVIYYILLQNLPGKSEVEIDTNLLPEGYCGYDYVVFSRE